MSAPWLAPAVTRTQRLAFATSPAKQPKREYEAGKAISANSKGTNV